MRGSDVFTLPNLQNADTLLSAANSLLIFVKPATVIRMEQES
jgi:hypothetical protein